MTAFSEHDGHRERLRRRFEKDRLKNFSPHEILELLLTYALPRINVNPLAHQLLDHFGSLSAVLEASPAELCRIKGIGPRAATLVAMMLPLFQQYEWDKTMPRMQLDTYSQLAAYCRTLFLGASTEQFYVICLDAKLKVLATEMINSGTPLEVAVSPRLVVRELIRHNAMGAVITHNHPSGSPCPSQEDLDVTEEIRKALQSVDIRLYDHLIIADTEDFSFHRHGCLETELPILFPAAENAQSLAADRPQRKLPPRGKK